MGYMDSRSAEVTQRLRDAQPAPTAEEKDKIQGAFDVYTHDGNDYLGSIRAIVGEVGTPKRTSSIEEHFGRWRAALSRFGECLNPVRDPSLTALALVTKISFEEKDAIDRLAAAQIGETRDAFVEQDANVETAIKALSDKWAKLNGESDYFDRTEKEAADAIRKMVEEAIQQSAAAADQLARQGNEFYQFVAVDLPKEFTDWVAGWGKAIDAPEKAAEAWKSLVKTADPGGYIKGQLASAAKMPSMSQGDPSGNLGAFIKASSAQVDGLVRQRAEEYVEAMRRRTSGILVLFNETRRDTEQFIKNNGFDVAKVKYQEMSDRLDRVVSGLSSDGLKTDVGRYAKELVSMFGRHLSDIELMFNRFVKENEGRFFGPLGPDIAEALTETKSWEQYRVGLVNMGLEEKLRQFRSDLNQFIVVKMTDAVKKMESEFDSVNPEIRREIETHYAAFRDEVMRQARERVAQLDALVGKQQSLLRSDALTAYFDRRILNDAIRR